MTAKEIRKQKVQKLIEEKKMSQKAAKTILREHKWNLAEAVGSLTESEVEIEVEDNKEEEGPKEGDVRYDFNWKDEEGDVYQSNDHETLSDAKYEAELIKENYPGAQIVETWKYKFKNGDWEFVERW